MTVEAAVVLPLFLLFFLNFASSIEMIRLHGNLAMGLWNTGRTLSSYGALLSDVYTDGDEGESLFSVSKEGKDINEKENQRNGEKNEEKNHLLEELGDLALTYTYVQNRVIAYVGENYLEQSPLGEGIHGLQFFESEAIGNGDIVDLIMTYRVSPFGGLDGLTSFRMANRYYAHLWNGYDIGGNNAAGGREQVVYVTSESEVYHTSSSCTHLLLSIREISYSELSKERNKDGGKYSPCEKCAKGIFSMTVFVCEEGDRYHYKKDCSGLKRSYSVMTLSEAKKDHRCCARCNASDSFF